MIISNEVSKKEVYQHWFKWDDKDYDNLVSSVVWCKELDIYKLTWYIGTLEKEDIDNLHIIYTKDWIDLYIKESLDTSVKAVHETFKKMKPNNLNVPSKNNNKVLKINKMIQDLINNPKCIERKMIIVACSKSGPFTIMDGNHRSIAFFDQNLLIGKEIYLGLSLDINKCSWVIKC